jgi:hypothetical protein
MPYFHGMKFFLLAVLIFSAALTKAQQRVHTLKLGNGAVNLVSYCTQKQPGIIWVHVHENETTSVRAAQALMDSLLPICLISWQHSPDQSNPQRNVRFELNGKISRFDPNRIFTPVGLEKTLKAQGNFSRQAFKAANKVSDFFIKNYIDGQKVIIALHNNSDSGGLHIKSYLPGGAYANDAAEVFVSETEDIDDFFYTTDKQVFDHLKKKGFNILLQNNATVTDDGSLSVYCGLKKMIYINIEAEMGHLQQQMRMMMAVSSMLDEIFN